jgi:hypothetical protein
MRTLSIIAAVALLILAALPFVPQASAVHPHLPVATLAMAAVLLVSLLASRGGKADVARPADADTTPAATVPPPAAVVPAAVMPAANQAEAEVVSFLALFQEKGRLIDFLMEDISSFSDAQVGAAARVVHSGCAAVLKENFAVCPVRDEREGDRVSVPAGYAADEYRLIGRIAGEAPFSGTLVHRGWKTGEVKLPRLVRRDGDRLPTIAPAEVELK